MKIYKADPIPGKKARWSRVELTEMLLSQNELYKMVDKNADQKSAFSQYQDLPAALRMLVNELIHHHKNVSSEGEWSCAHVQHYGSSLENPCGSQERERLVMILMFRPRNQTPWPRTPMGVLIDFEGHLASSEEEYLSETPVSDLEMDETDGEEASSSEV